MSGTLNLDQLVVEQLQVGKHVRIKSNMGSIEVHASQRTVGVWMNRAGAPAGTEQIGMVLQAGLPPYFCVWPLAGYWEPGAKPQVPFAISANGLQAPMPNGDVVQISLQQLAEAMKKLAN